MKKEQTNHKTNKTKNEIKKKDDIILFTEKPILYKDKLSKNVKVQSVSALSKYTSNENEKVFLDVSGIHGQKILELFNQIKESDYESAGTEGEKFLSSGIKLPSSSVFPGWKKMQSGMSLPFYLLYCSLEGKSPIDGRYNDKTVARIHNRFVEYLKTNLNGTEGLLWMDSGRDCLCLFPPKQKSIHLAIKACFKMLASAPLFTLECLELNMPVNFIFALHYGTINYKPPGKTGTVVSDAINFIFHLGTKKAEPGRLTLSGELPGVTVPKELQDCFVSTKDFEDRKIWQSRKFIYPKPWV